MWKSEDAINNMMRLLWIRVSSARYQNCNLIKLIGTILFILWSKTDFVRCSVALVAPFSHHTLSIWFCCFRFVWINLCINQLRVDSSFCYTVCQFSFEYVMQTHLFRNCCDSIIRRRGHYSCVCVFVCQWMRFVYCVYLYYALDTRKCNSLTSTH